MQHELPHRNIALSIEEQILRTAKRRQKRAPNRSDVFHGDDRKYILFLAAVPEQQDRQRYEDQKGYVIRDEHGGKEDAKYQEQA